MRGESSLVTDGSVFMLNVCVGPPNYARVPDELLYQSSGNVIRVDEGHFSLSK